MMQVLHDSARFRAVLAVAVVALGASACSLPSKPITTAATAVSKPFSSGEILEVLQTINNGELKQAQLALQRATTPAVRETAQLIVRDHTALNQRIATVAQATNTRLEESPLSRGLRLQTGEIAENLAGFKGTTFDCLYLRKQVEQHALSVETVRSQLLPGAENPQVRALVQAAVPVLEQHRQMAQAGRASIPQCARS